MVWGLTGGENSKALKRQRQFLSDAQELFGALAKQLDSLDELKSRHSAAWPAELNIELTRRNVLAGGRAILAFARQLKSATTPLSRDAEIELQSLAISCVKTSDQIGDLIAPLVVSDAMREAVGTSGGFGRKVS